MKSEGACVVVTDYLTLHFPPLLNNDQRVDRCNVELSECSETMTPAPVWTPPGQLQDSAGWVTAALILINIRREVSCHWSTRGHVTR